MAAIRPSSATIATLYIHFVIFIVVAIFNFTVTDNNLPVNLGYGVCLLVLSVISLLLGLTSGDPEYTLLRSLLMVASALWSGLGLFHVVETAAAQNLDDARALFAGYGTFLLVFLMFIASGLFHKDRFSAVIALGMALSCIFEIASLWRPLRMSAAAYYLLLAAMTLYLTVFKLFTRIREGEQSQPRDERALSKDYIPLGHAMNILAASVYAAQVTTISITAVDGFNWVTIAGIFQLVVAVVSVRRFDIYHGIYFFFHGLLWLTNGYDLIVIYSTQQEGPPLVAPTIIHFIVFILIALVSLAREIYQLPQNMAISILCVAILVGRNTGAFIGAIGWILFIFSLYNLAAHLTRVKNSGFKLPLGTRLFKPEVLAAWLVSTCKGCFPSARPPQSKDSQALFSRDFTLGYSRYSSLDSVGFALNGIAAVAILWSPRGVWVLPWAVLLGGLSQMVVGSVSFALGLSFESCCFFTFGSFWMIWGSARGLGVLELDNSAAMITGAVGFLSVGLLLLGLSTIISRTWFLVTFLFNLIIVGFLLHTVNANGSTIYEAVITITFVIACMYAFVATTLRMVWGTELLPLGKPFIQVSYLHSQGEKAFWADGRKASGVKAIADILNKGGICGIPTDVVYTLVAAAKFPHAIERVYKTKTLAEDRPMSMWISKVGQLEEGRPLFGEMVWGLMNEIWPSTVSLVVPKGDWYTNLGVGEAGKYIGRPDSIAVRMPDNAVTSHLIDQTGPVSVSSANPTGEADTTHHLQVLAKLGLDNCDGILCSGPSPENMASTVVDCRALNEGKIAFFRVGVVPRSHVEAIFEKVKANFRGDIPPSLSISSAADGGSHVNHGFQSDDEADNDSGNYRRIYPDGGTNTPTISDPTANISLDMSFAESTTGDDVNLIKPPRPTGGNSGSAFAHVNSIYESLVPVSFRDSRPDSQRRARSEISTSPSNQSLSSSLSDPYEPMQILGPRTVANQVKAAKQIGGKLNEGEGLHYNVNPLYSHDLVSSRTKL